MKSRLTIFLLLCSLNSFSQPYERIVDSTKLWCTLMACEPPVCLLLSRFQKFSGDTIIGSEHFMKVFEATDSLFQQYVEIGYIREDVDNKVYYRNLSGTQNYMIYDFQVEAGDTVNAWGNDLIISSVDSIQIGGYFRKRIQFNSTYPHETWVEGIGSLHGVGFGYTLWYVGCGYDLLCYFKNDSLLYHKDSISAYCGQIATPGCYYNTVEINEFDASEIILRINPNPVTSTSVITVDGNDSENYHLDIYNILGDRIKAVTITKNSQVIINKSEFAAGIYVVRILSESRLYSKKFVVQ